MQAIRIMAILLLAAAPARAQEAASRGELAPGAYEVDVRLELPNLDDRTASKRVTICVEPAERSPNRGLRVLSDNNPLAACPASDVRADAGALAFEIVCAGGNAARGTARYKLRGTAFDGRIGMKMGGKNMTMSETQAGRRVGECTAGAGPRS